MSHEYRDACALTQASLIQESAWSSPMASIDATRLPDRREAYTVIEIAKL